MAIYTYNILSIKAFKKPTMAITNTHKPHIFNISKILKNKSNILINFLRLSGDISSSSSGCEFINWIRELYKRNKETNNCLLHHSLNTYSVVSDYECFQ